MAISLVGTLTTGSAINGGDITLSLPSGLAQDDVVYVGLALGVASTGGTSSGGWTQVGSNVDTGNANLRTQLFRKVMGASPDTSIVLTGSGLAADSSSAIAIAFRGVDTTTPEDGVTPTTATGTTGGPDSPTITPNTTGAAAISWGAQPLIDVTGIGAPTGYTDLAVISSSDSNNTSNYMSWKSGLTGGVAENPSAYTGITSGRWVAWTIVVKPAAAASAVSTYDWPLPQQPRFSTILRTHTSLVQLTLLGKDQVYGAPGQVPAYDYPLPKVPHFSVLHRTFIDPVKLNLLGKDQVYGAPGQVPNYYWPLPPIGAARSRDLLTWISDTIPTSLLNPFFQTDWPLPPKAAARGKDLLTWISDVIPSTLAPPFVQTDWPLPPRGAKRSVELLTFTAMTPLNLIGQDKMYGDAGQVPNYDWPLPKLPLRSIDLRTWLLTFVPTTPQDPPKPRDWPVPLTPLRSQELKTFIQQTPLNLLGQDQMYGGPGQVPNYDWSLPKVAQYSVTLRTHINTFIPAQPNVPFNQTDWPLPQRPIISVGFKTWISDFVPPDGQVPFNQEDWPLPKVATPTIYRTWLNTFIPIDNPAPPPQSDLSTPQRRPAQQQLPQTNMALLAGAGAKPVVPITWELPLPKRTSVVSLTHLSTFIPPVGNRPFLVQMWPLPLRPLRSTSLQTWIGPIVPQTVSTRARVQGYIIG